MTGLVCVAPIVKGGLIALGGLMVAAALWIDRLPWVLPWVVVVAVVVAVTAGGGLVGLWVAS